MNKFFLLILSVCVATKLSAQGDLLITPVRVIFEGNTQVQEINLVNKGNDTTVYTVSFLNYKMNEYGSYEVIKTAGKEDMFSDQYLRIFPKRIKLAPKEPQVIMLQLRRKAGMKTGEYRSHLYFRAEKEDKNVSTEVNLKNTSKLGIQLTPVYGLSIPVIIRTGMVNVNISLSDIALESKKDQLLRLTIKRTGNISAYGDISVSFYPLTGKPYNVGLISGVGVYTDIDKRYVTIKLKDPSGLSISNGTLKIQYTGERDSKKFVYAEATLSVK